MKTFFQKLFYPETNGSAFVLVGKVSLKTHIYPPLSVLFCRFKPFFIKKERRQEMLGGLTCSSEGVSSAKSSSLSMHDK
jgi:hypothetical protein